ncbi:MAG TPA: hypothetical protein V6C97_11310 [Oculatellaceae cyanobacterium]
MSDENAKTIQEDADSTTFFEWGPESQTYHVRLDRLPRSKGMEQFMLEFGDLLGLDKKQEESNK